MRMSSGNPGTAYTNIQELSLKTEKKLPKIHVTCDSSILLSHCQNMCKNMQNEMQPGKMYKILYLCNFAQVLCFVHSARS